MVNSAVRSGTAPLARVARGFAARCRRVSLTPFAPVPGSRNPPLYGPLIPTLVRMTVDAVLFDLDGTLVDYRRSTAEVLAAAFDRAGVDPFFEAAEYHERFTSFAEEADTIEDLRRSCFAAIATDQGRDPADGQAVAEAYTVERDQTNVESLPGAVEAVETLAADHHVGLVTNGTREMQRAKLGAVGLADAFDAAVFAGDGIPAKPDPEPFEVALEELGVEADRAVHVGNSLSSDVAGAHGAGLGSVWLRQDGVEPDPQPRHVVDSMAELASPPW